MNPFYHFVFLCSTFNFLPSAIRHSIHPSFLSLLSLFLHSIYFSPTFHFPTPAFFPSAPPLFFLSLLCHPLIFRSLLLTSTFAFPPFLLRELCLPPSFILPFHFSFFLSSPLSPPVSDYVPHLHSPHRRLCVSRVKVNLLLATFTLKLQTLPSKHSHQIEHLELKHTLTARK